MNPRGSSGSRGSCQVEEEEGEEEDEVEGSEVEIEEGGGAEAGQGGVWAIGRMSELDVAVEVTWAVWSWRRRWVEERGREGREGTGSPAHTPSLGNAATFASNICRATLPVTLNGLPLTTVQYVQYIRVTAALRLIGSLNI